MNAECHACNKVIAYDDEAVCCKGYCYHKECRCLICGKLSDEQEEIDALCRALEKACDAIALYDECPSTVYGWTEREKCYVDCHYKETKQCWLQYFMEE